MRRGRTRGVRSVRVSLEGVSLEELVGRVLDGRMLDERSSVRVLVEKGLVQ